MAYSNPDDAYRPHIRLTETTRDQFGSKFNNNDSQEVYMKSIVYLSG